MHVPGDTADDRERIVDAALEELGRLDVVIIASGVVGFADMTDLTQCSLSSTSTWWSARLVRPCRTDDD